MSDELFDVIAVDLQSGAERFMAERKTRGNARAIMHMAVVRRGVEGEFFKVVPSPHRLAAARTLAPRS